MASTLYLMPPTPPAPPTMAKPFLANGKDDLEIRPTDDLATIRHKDVLRRQRSLRILGIIASIASILAFAFAIFVFVREVQQNEVERRRTEAYLKASDRFAQVLADKEVALHRAQALAEQQTNDIARIKQVSQQIRQDVVDLRAQLMQIAPSVARARISRNSDV